MKTVDSKWDRRDLGEIDAFARSFGEIDLRFSDPQNIGAS